VTGVTGGDGYIIDGNLWVWDGSNWTNTGQVVGPTGATGVKGDIGLTGATGVIGPTGPSGVTGATGAQGATGATGPVGLSGPTGPVGATGPKGDRGDTGVAGPTGPAGATGATSATLRDDAGGATLGNKTAVWVGQSTNKDASVAATTALIGLAAIPVPVTATFTKFYCYTNIALASGVTWTFQVFTWDPATATATAKTGTCSISPAAYSGLATGLSIDLTAGQLISVKVSTGTATTVNTGTAAWALTT
jgi:hypothetical protein